MSNPKSTDEMLENKEFTCPQCGSHMFGSGPPNHLTGHCHGLLRGADGLFRTCVFSWDRRDDSKYFRGTGIFRKNTVPGTRR
jgi:hypothetical protein